MALSTSAPSFKIYSSIRPQSGNVTGSKSSGLVLRGNTTVVGDVTLDQASLGFLTIFSKVMGDIRLTSFKSGSQVIIVGGECQGNVMIKNNRSARMILVADVLFGGNVSLVNNVISGDIDDEEFPDDGIFIENLTVTGSLLVKNNTVKQEFIYENDNNLIPEGMTIRGLDIMGNVTIKNNDIQEDALLAFCLDVEGKAKFKNNKAKGTLLFNTDCDYMEGLKELIQP